MMSYDVSQPQCDVSIAKKWDTLQDNAKKSKDVLGAEGNTSVVNVVKMLKSDAVTVVVNTVLFWRMPGSLAG